MITQCNKDELNIGRILMQCSLNESWFYTCKVPRRGDTNDLPEEGPSILTTTTTTTSTSSSNSRTNTSTNTTTIDTQV